VTFESLGSVLVVSYLRTRILWAVLGVSEVRYSLFIGMRASRYVIIIGKQVLSLNHKLSGHGFGPDSVKPMI
jgi:hypothetical protein